MVIWAIVSGVAMAQTSSARQPAPAPPGTTTAVNRASIEETRGKLLGLLRMDRKLSAFVARDPQLLADHEFIQRSNPELAAFVDEHPEVAKNPEFFLFVGGDRLSFSRNDWPDTRATMGREVADFVGPFMVFICLLLGVLWLVRTLMESKRWSRMLNVQTEAQNKLLDKFGGSEDLLAYLRSDIDKRLLLPIGVQLTPNGSSISNPIARILGPLQAGIILAIVGLGFIGLRSMGMTEEQDFFTVIGMIVTALGIGLIIAAAAGWIIARHFGLLPDRPNAPAQSGASAS